MKPRSNFIPSTTSSSFSRVLPSLTVITPSFPTRSMASEIKAPISCSLFAEIVATWAISALVEMGFERALSDSTTESAAYWIPRRRSIGFIPAATALHPSEKMARVNTVAVVVPSPATSLVLFATCRTSCAPMFMKRSRNSMFLATVTPSLVIFGAPYGWSRTALRPLGPRVTETASASLSTPCSMRARPSVPNPNSLPDILLRDVETKALEVDRSAAGRIMLLCVTCLQPNQ
mmetsp:Transcript_11197/g.33436  ORF Transcript_11197/g.33436 Transcript_11197/m.33436 type:complete len:233 (+) Transcript_11197:1504-2202(+)